MKNQFRTLILCGLSVCLLSQASFAQKVARTALTSEPPQLNSTLSTDQVSIWVLGHVMEGLTRVGKRGEVAPGVAEKWNITDKGATFNLRKDAKWSDGKPVTAKDFVFAWRTALDPKTASQYAFILYPIKNAEAINSGKMKTSELGVVAKDDYTVEVTFEKPCGYFLGLTSFVTYLPLREDFYTPRKDKYAANHGDMLYNGPFKLTKWVHGASLKMEKNSNYWNAKTIKLDAVDVPYITADDKARFNFFKDNKIDIIAGLSQDVLPLAQKEKYRLKNFQDGSVFYLEFNFRDGRVTRNENLRKAIQMLFNGSEYVQKVVGIPGTISGGTLIPSWIQGHKTVFRKEYPYKQPKADHAKAKEYLKKALAELKMEKIPSLVWLTGDSPTSAKESEYFQNLFKTVLGIDLKIDKQIFKQRLAKMTAGEFDIVSAGWGPDFNDPMTFAELFTSWNENNRGKYKNSEVDQNIRIAQSTTDQKKRMDAMAKAEKIMLDEVAILPMFERTVIYTHSNKLRGVARRQIGPDPDFTYAEVK